MKPDHAMDVASDLRDLQIVDSDGEICGIVDDLAFDGGPGKPAEIAAILVGPGTYAARLPAWMAWLARRFAGSRIVRVPWSEVEDIGCVVRLKCSAGSVGLGWAERRAEKAIKQLGIPDALV